MSQPMNAGECDTLTITDFFQVVVDKGRVRYIEHPSFAFAGQGLYFVHDVVGATQSSAATFVLCLFLQVVDSVLVSDKCPFNAYLAVFKVYAVPA